MKKYIDQHTTEKLRELKNKGTTEEEAVHWLHQEYYDKESLKKIYRSINTLSVRKQMLNYHIPLVISLISLFILSQYQKSLADYSDPLYFVLLNASVYLFVIIGLFAKISRFLFPHYYGMFLAVSGILSAIVMLKYDSLIGSIYMVIAVVTLILLILARRKYLKISESTISS